MREKKGIYTKVIETARNLINLGISRENISLSYWPFNERNRAIVDIIFSL